MGAVAITADLRPAEHDGLHYLGSVQDIIGLRTWDRVYMFPPCFQHLIDDSECLQHKLQDGRAFWAGALVLWCVCVASAHAVMVEQPDTLLHHVLDVSAYAGVVVLETSTAALGDVDRKFLRLTMRNFSPPTCSDYDPPSLPRPHHRRYRDPDLRDRARSSWRRFPMSSAALAELDMIEETVAPLSYSEVVSDFAVRWHAAGLPVPTDYMSLNGRPSTAVGRRYQLRRGPGDGRQVDAVTLPSRRATRTSARSRVRGYLISSSTTRRPRHAHPPMSSSSPPPPFWDILLAQESGSTSRPLPQPLSRTCSISRRPLSNSRRPLS